MSEIGRVNYGLTGEIGTAPITEYGKKNGICEHGVTAWKCTECMLGKNIGKREGSIIQEDLTGICKHGVDSKRCNICNVVEKKVELNSPEYFVMQRCKLEEELLNNLLEAMPEMGLRQATAIMSNRWLILSILMKYDKKLMDIIREEMSND